MRFESIELLRYGHFSGQNLIFPRRGYDFHLIVGGNEAGKSTLRQAFRDLLFGIPMNSPMAFLHAGPELALNAVLSGGQGELAMGRRRKRDGGLVDAAGEKLAPEVLGSWLGGVTEAFHERMFGLDHRRLEQGSRAMLQAGDDVDSVLFQAAAGLATLNGVLSALREEAAGLWTPHHSRNRAWYAASDRYKEADKAVRVATVRPNTWMEAQRESRRLDEAFAQARDECAGLRARLRELERLRRLAPLLAQIRECEALLSGDDAGRHGASPLLEAEADILELEETRLRLAGHRSDIDQCESHIGLLREQLGAVLRQLGREAPEEESRPGPGEAPAWLPPRPLRHEISKLLNEGRELRARRQASFSVLQARQAEAEQIRAGIETLPRMVVGRALRRALDAATGAGDVVAGLDALRRKAAQETSDLARRLAALRQPGVPPANSALMAEGGFGAPALDTEPAPTDRTGLGADAGQQAVAWLMRMQPWPAEALMEQVQRRREWRAEADAAGKRVRDAELELRAAQLRAEQFRRSHQAVSRDEVIAARRERDALWESLSAGRAPPGEQAERYASLVLLADVLADRHLAAVDDAARLQALEHECERLEAALQGLSQAQAAAAAELDAYDEQWRAACMQRHLPLMPPAELQGWLPGREAALQAYERLRNTRAELDALNERHDALLRDLQAALNAEDAAWTADAAACPEQSGVDLPLACEAARALLLRADGAAARREALAEQLLRLEPLLPALEQECHRDEAALDDWTRRRQAALQRAGLPQEADDAYVEAAIGLLSDADELLGRLRQRQSERERLEAELRHFTQAIGALAGRLGIVDSQPAMAEEQLRRWLTQLAPLRTAERDREQARRQLAGFNTRLLEEAEGRGRKQVEAELAAVDFSSLGAEAEALGLRLDEAEHQRDRLAVEREQARSALAAISGGDDAAQAEARRQEALADMAEVAERYVRVYAQTRLLEHITERYRERSQGPLLARAGQLFAGLTLGAHEGLVVDGEAAALWARRADGRLVPLEGLSDGTRDQLYLALRLAALELYLDSAQAMPFIADDLFVNYDDGRALAGLRQLAEVSRHTQVIFLTHHEHMAELARANLADQTHIIELHGGGPAGYTGRPT